jgi:methionyl aminopeptidase
VREGDLITFDVTVELDGYYADAAVTVPVGVVRPIAEKLCACAEAAFWKGYEKARSGELLANVGGAVEAEVRRHGFRVLRDLAGHGIGRAIHEEPSVLNFHDRSERRRLTNGLVIALEPIVSRSATSSKLLRDGWTLVSADRSLTAHFEHTIVITDETPIILTAA